MFLQLQVLERDKSCLRFLWRPTMNESVQIYKYQCHVFGAKSSPTRASYALKRVAIDNEDEFPNAAKTIQNKFYMDDFIKSVETPEESIKVFKQLQPLLSKHEFELKKWITNSDMVINAITEDLRSISNTKQVEVEPSKKGSSVLGLQWTIIDDSLQVCRGTSKEAETPITQRKILSLVSSVFDPLRLFAPFSVHMRRLLKSIWTKNGQHWDKPVEPNDEEEFLKWKDQLPEVAETSIDRRYFSTMGTSCVCRRIWRHNVRSGIPTFKGQRILSRLSICNRKVQRCTDATPFHTTIGTTSSSDGGEI